MFCSICESCSQQPAVHSAELTNNSRNNFTHSIEILPFLEFYHTFLLSRDRQRCRLLAGEAGSQAQPWAFPISLAPAALDPPRGEMFTASFQIDFSCLYSNDMLIAFQPKRYLTRRVEISGKPKSQLYVLFYCTAFLRASQQHTNYSVEVLSSI